MKTNMKIATSALALAMALILAACGGNASVSSNVSTGSSGKLAGKPWVTSIFQGNLPPEAPAAKDDIYTHFNYEYLASHQSQPSTAIQDHAAEMREANLATIKDSSKTGHDLDQLRIFYEQASDLETLRKTGLADVQPFLDRINAVTSVEEMNAVLSSEDFPFSPFVLSYMTLADTRDVNIVNVGANLALVDVVTIGGAYYQDTNDSQLQQSMENAIRSEASLAMVDLMTMGMSGDEVNAAFPSILAFEKAHGKYAGYYGEYSQKEFGAAAKAARDSHFTMSELCSACPNFPMKATLDKLGKGASPEYVSTREWLEAFNGLWTDSNIEVIKLIAKINVLAETRPYRNPPTPKQDSKADGQDVAIAESFAYEACNQQNTFAIVLAETYVDNTLGADAKPRLTKLSQELVDTYKVVMKNTTWVSKESQQRIIEKLDNMTLNILEPVGGYYDFSGVKLTPSAQGGTLIGNYLKLKQYRLDQESKMIGQPAVAASPWFMIRPTETNAFYDSTSNSINVYPGYVSSLMYTKDMSDLDLLAGVGFIIGHEISHGFDYQGAQFDAYGTPNPVFTDADASSFVQKCSTLASYYNGIEVAPDVMANGQYVITEAAADLCGMQVTLELLKKVENADYEQFFAKISNVWARVVSEAALSELTLDVHPLNNLRINVNAQMFDSIYDKLGVSEGDAMYLAPDKRINIWGANA